MTLKSNEYYLWSHFQKDLLTWLLGVGIYLALESRVDVNTDMDDDGDVNNDIDDNADVAVSVDVDIDGNVTSTTPEITAH